MVISLADVGFYDSLSFYLQIMSLMPSVDDSYVVYYLYMNLLAVRNFPSERLASACVDADRRDATYGAHHCRQMHR